MDRQEILNKIEELISISRASVKKRKTYRAIYDALWTAYYTVEDALIEDEDDDEY